MTENSLINKRNLIKHKTQKEHHDANLSITFLPGELQRMLNETLSNLEDSSVNVTSFNSRLTLVNSDDHSMIEDYKGDKYKDKKADVLFAQFLEILQSHINDSEIFDTIQDLMHTCAGVLDIIEKDDVQDNTRQFLQQEIKTWKLLHALYNDRILLQQQQVLDHGMDCDMIGLADSEKVVINQLYNVNSTLREYQLVIDWLEACYEKVGKNILIGHTTGPGVAWENTLFQLKKQKQIAFGTGVELVKSMDPDAPVREKRPLHALDEEDDVRLSCAIYEEIRQGRIDEAIALCKYCGQSWRAAILEGWRLHDDPNYDPINGGNINEKLPIEGNPHRDIWKKCAWLMANSKKYNEYTRAIAGAFCGHLESLKSLSGNTWDDLLWSYLKVQVDIRVESEIRASCMKTYYPMPEAYWNSKMTLEEIFNELMAHNDASVRDYAKSKMATIQKYLILDNVNELFQQMLGWINGDEKNLTVFTENISYQQDHLTPHMLRFFTHIVLFMRQIGRIEKESTADHIISAYVKCLIAMGDAQLVAFYTAALPTALQIVLYSKFLETVNKTPFRKAAIEQAINAGLDIENITRNTVETIRDKLHLPAELHNDRINLRDDDELIDLNKVGSLQMGEISKFDYRKINALEWLTFIPSQRGELLWQANAMIRTFLAENKCECVKAVYEIVPTDSITNIINVYGSKDNLPCREECSIKEYLSYKVYLAAIDNFNEWMRLYHNRPKEPEQLNDDANFTDRIAFERKEQLYLTDLNRWTNTLEEQVNVCRDALYNVLIFPDKGWLIDPDTLKESINIDSTTWECRQIQMEKLRSIYIPEIILLLFKVLYTSEDYQGCIQLAEEIASENRQLYKVYTKHKLADLLSKLAEASLELLNKKFDPWGYSVAL